MYDNYSIQFLHLDVLKVFSTWSIPVVIYVMKLQHVYELLQKRSAAESSAWTNAASLTFEHCENSTVAGCRFFRYAWKHIIIATVETCNEVFAYSVTRIKFYRTYRFICSNKQVGISELFRRPNRKSQSTMLKEAYSVRNIGECGLVKSRVESNIRLGPKRSIYANFIRSHIDHMRCK